jgi:hypothetical protein
MKKIVAALCLCSIYATAQNFLFTQAPGSPLSVTYKMRSIIPQDVNNDGKKDLVVGGADSMYTNQRVFIYLNQGNGSFTAAPAVTVGTSPLYIVFANFNNDAYDDMATANYNSNNVSIMLGSSTGVFTQAVGSPIATGQQPYCIDDADFNMDGKTDLITSSVNSNSIHLLLGNGSGAFSVAPAFPIAAGGMPYHIVAGKFNSDAFPDFACVNGSGNTLQIYLGNGNGTFASPQTLTTGQQPRTIAVADLNNDTWPDMVVPNSNSNSLSIYLGSSSGTYAPSSSSPLGTGAYPYQASIADYDQNGTLDLFVSNCYANTCSLFSGTGGANFTAVSSSTIFNGGSLPQTNCTDDFNGDGKMDIAVADWDNNKVRVFLRSGQTTAIIESLGKSGLDVYPNPSQGLLNLNGAAPGSELTVYASDGEKVFSRIVVEENETIELKELNNGIYFCQLKLDDGSIRSARLIICR